MKIEKKSGAYLWFDTEFTSLDMERARLLQVALVITDVNLRRLAPADQDFMSVVRLDPDAKVSPWVAEHLGGLIARCRAPEAPTAAAVDIALAEYVERWLGPAPEGMDGRPLLAGNSLQTDWTLAARFLPGLMRRVHYRLLDVSVLKTLWRDQFDGEPLDKEQAAEVVRWSPLGAPPPDGKEHDALYDVHASVAELNYYRQQLRRVSACG